jgi:hypothetical protein
LARLSRYDQFRWEQHLGRASIGAGEGGVMASASFAPNILARRRVSLSEIDAAVSARLGPTKAAGNSQPGCFNRQVAMYLASRIGRWPTTTIGRFYNGRDHSTVCYGIQRIENLRDNDPDADALISDLARQLDGDEMANVNSPTTLGTADLEKLAGLIAARVCAYLKEADGRDDRDEIQRLEP